MTVTTAITEPADIVKGKFTVGRRHFNIKLLGAENGLGLVLRLGLGLELSVEAYFFHHFSGFVLEFLEKLDFTPAVIGLFILLLLNKEDIVIALANEGVLHLFSFQPHQDLIFFL